MKKIEKKRVIGIGTKSRLEKTQSSITWREWYVTPQLRVWEQESDETKGNRGWHERETRAMNGREAI